MDFYFRVFATFICIISFAGAASDVRNYDPYSGNILPPVNHGGTPDNYGYPNGGSGYPPGNVGPPGDGYNAYHSDEGYRQIERRVIEPVTVTTCPDSTEPAINNNTQLPIKCLPHMNLCPNEGGGTCCHYNEIDYFCCSNPTGVPCPVYNNVRGLVREWKYRPDQWRFVQTERTLFEGSPVTPQNVVVQPIGGPPGVVQPTPVVTVSTRATLPTAATVKAGDPELIKATESAGGAIVAGSAPELQGSNIESGDGVPSDSKPELVVSDKEEPKSGVDTGSDPESAVDVGVGESEVGVGVETAVGSALGSAVGVGVDSPAASDPGAAIGVGVDGLAEPGPGSAIGVGVDAPALVDIGVGAPIGLSQRSLSKQNGGPTDDLLGASLNASVMGNETVDDLTFRLFENSTNFSNETMLDLEAAADILEEPSFVKTAAETSPTVATSTVIRTTISEPKTTLKVVPTETPAEQKNEIKEKPKSRIVKIIQMGKSPVFSNDKSPPVGNSIVTNQRSAHFNPSSLVSSSKGSSGTRGSLVGRKTTTTLPTTTAEESTTTTTTTEAPTTTIVKTTAKPTTTEPVTEDPLDVIFGQQNVSIAATSNETAEVNTELFAGILPATPTTTIKEETKRTIEKLREILLRQRLNNFRVKHQNNKQQS